MARFTIKGFAKALGVDRNRDGITRSGIILKTLNQRGMAPIVGKVHPHVGRPALVYNVDKFVARALKVKTPRISCDPILDTSLVRKVDVWEVLEMTNKVRESMGLDYMYYDAFALRLLRLRKAHRGGRNPYEAIAKRGSTRLFSMNSARTISRTIAPMKVKTHGVYVQLRKVV